MMRHYGDQDNLCLARSGSCVEEIPDIGDVEYTADGGQKIVVVGIMQLNLKKVCSNCKERVESLSNSIGQYIKCLMMQKIDTCSDQVCAKLLVESNGESKIIVHGF